jgi:hypothetical protein
MTRAVYHMAQVLTPNGPIALVMDAARKMISSDDENRKVAALDSSRNESLLNAALEIAQSAKKHSVEVRVARAIIAKGCSKRDLKVLRERGFCMGGSTRTNAFKDFKQLTAGGLERKDRTLACYDTSLFVNQKGGRGEGSTRGGMLRRGNSNNGREQS